MAAAIVILTITVAGIPLVLAIRRDSEPLSLIGLAFLFGSGTLYLVMLLFSVAGIAWSLAAVTAVMMLIALGAHLLSRNKPRHSFVALKPSPVDILTIVVVIAYARHALSGSPLFMDFWAIWGLKGRVFFEMNGIDWRFLESPWNAFAHPDYPLLLPLNYAATALAQGAWSDRWLGLFSIAFAIALLLVVRSEAARDADRHFAAAIALATSAFALMPEIGIADGPFIAFATAGLLMMRNGDMRTASCLLGLAASTKNEGLTLIVSAVVAFGVGLAVIHWLLKYISTHTFKPFVIYRLCLAALVAVLLLTGVLEPLPTG